MNRDAVTIDELVEVTLIALESATATASFQQVPAMPKAKPNTALKPTMLKRDDMPVTMRAWIEQYVAYHRTSHLDTDKDQQTYFLTLLDSSLRARIKASLTDDTPVLTITGQDSCISILEKSFMAKHPLFTRRLNFRYTHSWCIICRIPDQAESHSR